MGTQEYLLLIFVVILVPLAIAVIVTLWTLEQARMRSKKNRKAALQTKQPDAPPVDPA